MHDMTSKASSHVFDAQASRAIDARAITQIPVSGFTLMQRAAGFAWQCLLKKYPRVTGLSVWCGKGNNAGDAYLVAALAHHYGLRVQLVALYGPEHLSGDAATAYQQVAAAGLVVESFDEARTVVSGELVVDGLLGTGFKGQPRAEIARALAFLNAVACPIVSIDVPSGVNASTGAVCDNAIRADLTVSFITQKIGLFSGPGVAQVGERCFDDLAVPGHIYCEAGVPLRRFDPARVPIPGINTHKHRQGHVVVVGSDIGMPGAVTMSAEAALRSGAGMVTVVTQGQHTNAIIARTPEVMVVDAQAEQLSDILRRADLFVLGPGLGRRAWGEALYDLVQQFSSGDTQMPAGVPVVLDADGLYWLAMKQRWEGGNLYITPHAAEAARLLNVNTAGVVDDRLAAAEQLAGKFQCAGVLKGAGSVMFSAAGLSLCAHGNPGMATAGMGDVLSGIIAGFMAGADDVELRGNCFDLAVMAHSAAADLAAEELGYRSLTATDVITRLPQLLNGKLCD